MAGLDVSREAETLVLGAAAADRRLGYMEQLTLLSLLQALKAAFWQVTEASISRFVFLFVSFVAKPGCIARWKRFDSAFALYQESFA